LPTFSTNVDILIAMKSEYQLSKLKRSGIGISYVAAMLNELTAFVRCDLNDLQVVQTAEMICQEFWYLKAEELILIFKKGMKTKQYGGFNFQIFCEWVQNYEQSKLEVIESMHQSIKGKYHINAERTSEVARISKESIDWASQQKAIQNLKK